VNDLDLVRQHRQIQALEAAEEDRWLLRRVGQVYDREQELYGPTDDYPPRLRSLSLLSLRI
jgi:hypothetical protein